MDISGTMTGKELYIFNVKVYSHFFSNILESLDTETLDCEALLFRIPVCKKAWSKAKCFCEVILHFIFYFVFTLNNCMISLLH